MIISIISQGLFWSILGLGIFMTFRILNFPDMTTEGSFPLGGAVAVTLITKGVNPLIATLIAILAGCLAGFATGDNPDMASSFGINTGRMELMGLVLSNGVIALAGALIAQQEGYADASRGIGVIVIGLASLIIGEVLFKSLTLAERLMTIVVGAIAYQFLIWAVIALGFNTSYLRLYSAVILAICLMIPTLKNKFFKGVTLSK